MLSFLVHDRNSAPEQARPTLEAAARAFGFVPNLLGVMATSPALAEAYLALSGIFSKSGLTPAEQQIVLLTVSRFHQCGYCMAAHSMVADMQKVPREVTDAIRVGHPIPDPKLEALRQLTAAFVEHRGYVPEAQLQTFLDVGYQPTHILDVLIGVAQKTLSNYTNHLAGTPLDAPMQSYAWTPSGNAKQ